MGRLPFSVRAPAAASSTDHRCRDRTCVRSGQESYYNMHHPFLCLLLVLLVIERIQVGADDPTIASSLQLMKAAP